MKTYVVVIETNEDILSTFTIHADNLKEAKRIAQFHKRTSTKKQCRTRVYLDRDND